MSRNAVTEAAQILDRESPGWRDQINLDELDLRSETNCILGQLHGHFCNMPRSTFDAISNDMFNSAFCENDGETDAWRQVIHPAVPVPA